MKLDEEKRETIANVIVMILFVLMMTAVVLATSLTLRSSDISSPLYVVINGIEY